MRPVHLKMDFGFSILDVASKSGSQKWIQILILDVAKIWMQNVDFGIKSRMSAQILDLENSIWHAKMDFGFRKWISKIAFGMQKWILDLENGSRK